MSHSTYCIRVAHLSEISSRWLQINRKEGERRDWVGNLGFPWWCYHIIKHGKCTIDMQASLYEMMES